ncbi:MAG: hypothetical protein KAQ66_07690, partial [Rhodospirillaceae bacterium]|nr:hypothetical protein [Rhodospirillaceae bacterium]
MKQKIMRRLITFFVFLLILPIVASCSSAKQIISGNSTAGLALPSDPRFGPDDVRINESPATRWDVYYSNLENAPAEIRVMEPLGTSRPMGKLLANSVAEHLERAGVKASTEPVEVDVSKINANKMNESKNNIFILTGNAEVGVDDPNVRYAVIIRWILSDTFGRVIATHSQGVVGSRQDWDVGDPRLLRSVGVGIAEPMAAMATAEIKPDEPPADPLTKGVLMAGINGLSVEDGKILSKGMAKELLIRDILVTEDPRQATYVLGGLVEMVPTTLGMEMARIIWRVGQIDGPELGNAVQEKEVAQGSLGGRWA